MFRRIWIGASLGLAIAFAAIPVAGAAQTTLQDASYTVGNSGAVNITRFDLTSAGTLTVKLTDIPWPQPLAGAEFMLSTATGEVIGRLNTFGTASFDISGPGTLYALSYGIVNNLPGLNFGFGTYGLNLSFSPSATTVPLPAAGGLMAGGMLLLLSFRSRRRVPSSQHLSGQMGVGSGNFAINL